MRYRATSESENRFGITPTPPQPLLFPARSRRRLLSRLQKRSHADRSPEPTLPPANHPRRSLSPVSVPRAVRGPLAGSPLGVVDATGSSRYVSDPSTEPTTSFQAGISLQIQALFAANYLKPRLSVCGVTFVS